MAEKNQISLKSRTDETGKVLGFHIADVYEIRGNFWSVS
jgi:hypothetical protein